MQAGKNRRRGYTLIELAVTLAIVGVLSAAAMHGWQGMMRRQQRAEGKAALFSVMQQEERHFARHGRYQPFDSAAAGAFMWHSGPTPGDSVYALSAVVCAGDTASGCIMAVAQAGGAGVRAGHADPECGVLRLDSRGRQQADGGAACW